VDGDTLASAAGGRAVAAGGAAAYVYETAAGHSGRADQHRTHRIAVPRAMPPTLRPIRSGETPALDLAPRPGGSGHHGDALKDVQVHVSGERLRPP
jgi:hypothetical protein